MKPATKYIHAGMEPDPSTGAIMTPIYQTSTYVQSAPGKHRGFEYARSQNPTRKALEDAIAVIENGKYGLAFSSGVAATDAVIKLLSPGDEVIAANDMYGGTYRLFTKVFEKFGIKFHYVDMRFPHYFPTGIHFLHFHVPVAPYPDNLATNCQVVQRGKIVVHLFC